MPRIEIELTSARPDGTWTWRAAGARQPKGVLDGSLLHTGAKVGDVLRADATVEIDGINVTAVTAPRPKRAEPERLTVSGPQREEPLVSGPPGAMKGEGSEGRSRGGFGGRGGAGGPGGPGGFGDRGPGGPGRAGGGGRSEGRSGGRDDRRSGTAHPVATTHTRRPAPEPVKPSRPGRDSPDRGRRERPPGDRPRGDRPRGDRSSRDRPSHDRAGGDRPGRDRFASAGDGADRGRGRTDGPGRRPGSSSSAPSGGTRGRGPATERPKRFQPGRSHRDAVLATLAPEERPVAEQVLRGGLAAVRHALETQNAKARAAGQAEIRTDALLAMAEALLPRLRAADWRDRAEAAAADLEGIGLRDLRAIVTGSEPARDDESRELAAKLREALERRSAAECEAWLEEISSSLTDGRVVRALRASARPPQAGIRFPSDLSERLTAAAGEAMGPDTPTDRWTVLLDAVGASPVRRAVKPRGFPANPDPELADAAGKALSRIPGLATLEGVPQPVTPSRPGVAGRPPGAIPPPPPRPPRPAGAVPSPPAGSIPGPPPEVPSEAPPQSVEPDSAAASQPS